MATKDFKIAIGGPGGVGKSAIVLQFVTGNYVSEYDPTIEDAYRKQFALGDNMVMVDMLDTAGMEEFSAMRDQWMRTHDGFILVFGLDSRSSLNDTEVFFEQIVRVKDGLPFCAVLVGNKRDDVDRRQVESAEAIAMARRWNVPYVEATAKENVDHIFAHLLYDMEAARVALATTKEKEEPPATKKTEADKNSTWQQDMLALVNEPSSADIRIFINHQGAVSGPIFGHSMIIGRQSPKLRELFAQAKQSAGACGVGQAADALPAVTLSHVSPAVVQFLLGYFYSSTLALPSFLELQGQAVIAELYRSIGGTSDAPKAPEAADSSSSSSKSDAEGMRRAWKLVRQVYKNPKRPDTITLDRVDAESVVAINSYVPLLQRVMAQGRVSTASAAHLRAVVQHMHTFATAYEISALQEFLDQRLAALNLLSECGKAMDQVMSVIAPFFEEWEAVKASSAIPASAYFARFLELLARHGVRFVLEMVRFVKLLAGVRELMGADVTRMLTTLIVDRTDAVFLRLSLALIDLHLARRAHEGETEQASAEYVTRLLVQWESLLDPLAALLDARQSGGAVAAADGDSGATAAEGDEVPAAEKKTRNLEHTLNLRKKEKKRRAQSPDDQAKYFRSYMKTGLSSLKEFLPEFREELIKHATGKPTSLTRKHLPTFFNDLADNLCKWSKANKHYNEAMHHPNLVTAAVEQLVAALAFGREAEKHIGRDIHAVAQVVLSDELREILIETGVIKREYASETDEQNKPRPLASNGNAKVTAASKTEEPEIETSKAKEVAKADKSEHGAAANTPTKDREGGDKAGAEAQPDRTKAFLPRLGIEEESDLAFVVEGQHIFCYRAMLMGRSQHFRISFTGYMERFSKEILVPDHSCAAFAAFLHYLYYDRLPQLDASDTEATLVGWCDGQFRVASPLSAGDILLEVMAISDEYHDEHLKELVLGQLLPFVDVDNVVFLHMMAQLYNAMDLRNKCMVVMSENFKKIHDEHFPAALKVPQGVVPQEATTSEAEAGAKSSSGHKEDRIELDEATTQQLIKGWEERCKQIAQCQKGFLFVPLAK